MVKRQFKTTLFMMIIMLLGALPTSAQEQPEVLTVDRMFALLEENSSELRVAKSGVEVAEHGIAAAKSERLPDVNASLSLSYIGNVVMTDRDFDKWTAFSSPHVGNSFALEAQQMVYTGGALTAGIQLAEIGKEQARTAVDATRDGQRFMAMAQYLELMEADNAIIVYERNIALTATLIDDIEAKRSQGMALKNDITRYELQMETLRLGLRRTKDSRDVLNHQLCNTLGLSSDIIIVPDTTLMSLAADDNRKAWQDKAASLSPELAMTELNIKASEQQLRLARSEQMPKLYVYAADNFNGPYTFDIPPIDNNFNTWQIGVGVSYSLSSLFKANKNVRKANASIEESRLARSRTAIDIDNRMFEAHTLYLQAFEDLKTKCKNAQLARENYDVVNNRYLNDIALITDMTDASNILLSAELDETNARIQIVYAYYRMKYIAGDI